MKTLPVKKINPVKLAEIGGIPLLASEIKELHAQICFAHFLKKKNLQDKILSIMKKENTSYTTACRQVGIGNDRKIQLRKQDVMFNRRITRVLLKRREFIYQKILNYLDTGGDFEGACKIAGITTTTGWHFRAEDYNFDMACQQAEDDHIRRGRKEGGRNIA